MGCGCGKKGVTPRRPSLRPSVGPKPIVGGTAAAPNPAELRAVGLQKSVSVGESRRMDEQRRRIERIRRQAIQAKLNK